MLSGIEGMLNLTTVGGLELGRAADIVTDGLTALGMEAKDTGKFVDVLAATITNANTDVEGFGEAMKYVGPVAGALGVKLEDLSLAIGLMANSGIKGSQAGTALRGGLTKLLSPTKEGAALMKEYGIQAVYGADGNLDLSKTMDSVRKGFSNLTQEQKAQAAEAIFGKTAMAGWLSIINATEEDMKLLQDAINGSKDAAAKLAEKFDNTAEGAMLKMLSSLENLKIALSDKFEPAVVAVYKATEKFFNLLAEGKKFDAINFVAEKISEWSNLIPEALTWLTNQFAVFVDQSLPKLLKAGTDILDNILKGFNQNEEKLGTSINKAVGLISAWVAENSPKIKEIGKTILTFVKNGIEENKPIIKDAVRAFVEAATALDTETKGLLVEFGLSMAGAIVNGFLTGLLDGLREVIMSKEVDEIIQRKNGANLDDREAWADHGFKNAQEYSKALAVALKTGDEETVKRLTSPVEKASEKNYENGKKGGKNTVKGTADGIEENSPEVKRSMEKVNKLMEDEFNLNTSVPEAGKELSIKTVDEMKAELDKLSPESEKAMLDAAQRIKQAASDMYNGARYSFSKLGEAAGEEMDTMFTNINDRMSDITTAVKQGATDAYNGAKKSFSELRDVATEKFISLNKVASTQFGEIRNVITEKCISAKKVVSTQMGEMATYGQDKIRALSNTVQGCMNTIKTSLNISTQVYKVISDFNKLSTALSKKVTANIQINKSVSTLSAPMLNIPDVYSSAPNLNNVPSLQYDNSQSHTGSSRRSNGNQHMDIYLSIDGASFAKATTKYTNKETARIDLRKARLAGGF